MSKVEVRQTLDLTKFISDLERNMIVNVTVNVNNSAINKVRVDSGDLRRNIRYNIIGDEGEIITDLPYSAAQEYGRPDLINYGFTPYMRPAAIETGRSQKTREATKRAVKDSSVTAKTNKVIKA